MYTSNLLPTTRFWKINYKKVKRIPLLEINYVFSFGLELWCLTALPTILQLTVSFIGGGNLSTRKKTLPCPMSLKKRYHIMLHRVHLAMSGIRTHNVRGDKYWLLPYDHDHDGSLLILGTWHLTKFENVDRHTNSVMLRERPFNLKGGGGRVYGFFLKKIFWFPMLLKKIFCFWWRKKKIIWLEFL